MGFLSRLNEVLSSLPGMHRQPPNILHDTPSLIPGPSALESKTREPRKMALLIGAKYSEGFFMGQLGPSHEAIWGLHHLLTKSYGYDESLIKVLIDDGLEEAPTRENIVREMKKLLQESIAGDKFFLYFSGHGGQMERAPWDTDEPDGFDEALIPCDATEDPLTWIMDDDMRKMLVLRVPVGSQLTAFFDLCHAGTWQQKAHMEGAPSVDFYSESADGEEPSNSNWFHANKHGSLTVRKDLSLFVDNTVLSELMRLDLTKCLTSMSAEATGHGGFSEVFRGRAQIEGRVEADVAVKRLRFHVKTTDCKRLFEQEIYVWSKLNHPNVLPLLGYAFCGSTGYPLLISNWMRDGTAWSYVKANPQLTVSDIRDLVSDIALGLSYLHDMNVVHSDLKSDNVLISPEGRALISDFGSARMSLWTQSIARITPTTKGTCLFWAPELLNLDNDNAKHSKETDVWAFGMTVYELLSKKRPYEGKTQGQVLMAIVLGRVPPLPPTPHGDENVALHKELLQLCEMCWEFGPSSRPRMSDVTVLDIFHESQTRRLQTGQERGKGGQVITIASSSDLQLSWNGNKLKQTYCATLALIESLKHEPHPTFAKLASAIQHRPSPAPMRGIVVPAMPCDLLMKENSNQDVGDDIATALDHKSPIVIDQQMLSDSGGEQLQRTVLGAEHEIDPHRETFNP